MAAEITQPSHHSELGIDTRGPRPVVLIDDERGLMRMHSLMIDGFTDPTYQVIGQYTDPSQVIDFVNGELAKTDPMRFLLLTDGTIPPHSMTGLDLARQIRIMQGPKLYIPMVLLSGETDKYTGLSEELQRAGAEYPNPFDLKLQKPVRPMALLHAGLNQAWDIAAQRQVQLRNPAS